MWRVLVRELIPGRDIPRADGSLCARFDRLLTRRHRFLSSIAARLPNPPPVEEIDGLYARELERRSQIDQKAFWLVSLTQVFGGLTGGAVALAAIAVFDGSERIVVTGLAVVPTVYLVSGLMLALGAWRVGMVGWVSSTMVYRAAAQGSDGTRRLAAEKLYVSRLNEILNTRRANFLTTAESLVRNGVVSLVVIGLGGLLVSGIIAT